MRSAISFKDRLGDAVCLNTDRITAVLEDTHEGERVSYIIADQDARWLVRVPHYIIIMKIAEAVNEANRTGEFVCVDLSS